VLVSGRYQLHGELGRGGMGSAHRALDTATGRVVALKFLDDPRPQFSALFAREYRTLATLKHPCVIEVYDFGIAQDGRHYYTMELVDGKDLATLSPIPWRSACEYLRDLATSLTLLHARKLVHRDVSPRNVCVSSSGRAKLLDFGTVSPFGIASELAGTPACIAPEALRGLPLDARTDLFSLGVTAYWVLTNQRPYAVRDLRDAENAWSQAPATPSELVPDIPRALDQLVLGLLSVDPMGRPGSAAEVMERLIALADLDEEPLAGVAKSHLQSVALAGRERERTQLTEHLERALSGQGGLVVVEGVAGMGKSRLTAELAIQARLAGMTTLHVATLDSTDPAGLVTALASALIEAAPAEAIEALRAHPALVHALEPLKRFAGEFGARFMLPREPLEQRALVQQALVSWLLDVAVKKPLAIVADDVHAADPASLGALIALAHVTARTRLLLVVTLLPQDDAGAALLQLTRAGSRIKLRQLGSDALAELVGSAFGAVPHISRLARWIESVSAGNPGQALELLSDLIERGVIRYAGGAWALPDQLAEEDLPRTLDESLAGRLSLLSPAATRLARVLALHRAPAALTLCRHLLPELTASELHDTIEQLVSHQIVIGAQDNYRIGNDALRAVLVQGMQAAERERLHGELGRALLAGLAPETVARVQRAASTRELALMLQAGWHLMHAKAGPRARDLLRDAGIELAHRGDGFAEAVPALRAALAEYEREGHSQYERAYLMIPLTLAGVYIDYRLAHLYGEPLIEILSEAAGLQLAKRLQPRIGARAALAVALGTSFCTWRFSQRRRLAHTFRELLLGLIATASAVLGNTSTLMERERAERVARRLEPLGWFPDGHIVRIVHRFHIALVDCAAGRHSRSRAGGREVWAALSDARAIPGLPDDARAQLRVGVLLLLGSLDAYRTDGSVHDVLAALDREHTAISRQTAAGIRVNYHLARGEQTRHEQCLAELDMLAAQLGSTWRQDVLVPRNAWWPAALCEDVLGLKRAVRKLERLSEEHENLIGMRDAAHACYLVERGRAQEALSRYGESLQIESQNESLMAVSITTAYARVLRAAGKPERARAVCEAALGRLSSEDMAFAGLVYYVQLERALSRAEMGEHQAAATELDALISAQTSHDNPLIHGWTHRARAQVALLAADAASFQHHLRQMSDWFRRAENPALVGQAQRFADEGRRAGMLPTADSLVPGAQGRREREQLEARRAFLSCRGPAERLQLALDLLVERAAAASGYLYLLGAHGLRYAAPMVGIEPPAELQLELTARIRVETEDDETRVAEQVHPNALRTVIDFEHRPANDQRDATYTYLVLSLEQPDKNIVIVGAVALVPGSEPTEPVDRTFLEEVARGIYDAGDVRTLYFQPAATLVKR
jgi:Protein kinase domain/AAA ATPase domain